MSDWRSDKETEAWIQAAKGDDPRVGSINDPELITDKWGDSLAQIAAALRLPLLDARYNSMTTEPWLKNNAEDEKLIASLEAQILDAERILGLRPPENP